MFYSPSMSLRKFKALHGKLARRSKVHSTSHFSQTQAQLHSVLIQHSEGIPEPKDTDSGQDLYFEVLELQPIKLSISFTRTERVSGEDKYGAPINFFVDC